MVEMLWGLLGQAAEDAGVMNRVIVGIDLWGFSVTITPWKLIGYVGVACFGARWLVQIIASTRARQSVVPLVFWFITLVGASFQFAYFVWGKNDSVGVLASLAPMAVAAYNLTLEFRRSTRSSSGSSSSLAVVAAEAAESQRPSEAAESQRPSEAASVPQQAEPETTDSATTDSATHGPNVAR